MEKGSQANFSKRIFTAKDVADYTGYSIKYLYKLVHERSIPFYKPKNGRRLFFLKDEIEQWLTTNKGNTSNDILG